MHVVISQKTIAKNAKYKAIGQVLDLRSPIRNMLGVHVLVIITLWRKGRGSK